MDLTSPKNIKALLAAHNAKPSRGLGQNFLIDKKILNKIIGAAELQKNDAVLEVGPGIGVLTRELAENAGRVFTVEKDKKMVEILTDVLGASNIQNVEIIGADILKFDNLKLASNYKIVANIPYYLTSPLIRKFLEAENQPQTMVLMVQKEVARRICSKPPNMSLLAISVQFYAKPEIVSYVSKNCFWPAPKIDSAIIKITPHKNSAEQVPAGLFFRTAKAGFLHPRKQLAGNLSKGLKLSKEQTLLWLEKSGVKPDCRAENLSVENWKTAVNNLISLNFLKEVK